jgi:hypothetical protein
MICSDGLTDYGRCDVAITGPYWVHISDLNRLRAAIRAGYGEPSRDNEPHCEDLTWGAVVEMHEAGCRPGVKYYRVPQQCGSRYVRRDEVPAALFEGREGQTRQWDDMGEAQVAYWCRVVDWLEAGNSSLYGELPDWADA